jgi:hypothetical protein
VAHVVILPRLSFKLSVPGSFPRRGDRQRSAFNFACSEKNGTDGTYGTDVVTASSKNERHFARQLMSKRKSDDV